MGRGNSRACASNLDQSFGAVLGFRRGPTDKAVASQKANIKQQLRELLGFGPRKRLTEEMIAKYAETEHALGMGIVEPDPKRNIRIQYGDVRLNFDDFPEKVVVHGTFEADDPSISDTALFVNDIHFFIHLNAGITVIRNPDETGKRWQTSYDLGEDVSVLNVNGEGEHTEAEKKVAKDELDKELIRLVDGVAALEGARRKQVEVHRLAKLFMDQ